MKMVAIFLMSFSVLMFTILLARRGGNSNDYLVAEANSRATVATQQTELARVIADAMPSQWPLALVFLACLAVIGLIVRWHMATITHVTYASRPQAPLVLPEPPQAPTVLLPDTPGFYLGLRQYARENGYQITTQGADYLLVDDLGQRQRVKQLEVRQ